MTGSAPPSGGSRGRPFLRPMRERSALHHDAPSRSGVPAALPQSQGLRPLSLVHLLLLADAKNPRRRLARTARSSAGGGPTTLRKSRESPDSCVVNNNVTEHSHPAYLVGNRSGPTFPIWLKSCLSNSSMVFQPLSNYGPFLRVPSYNNSMMCHFAVRCRKHHGGT